MENNKHLLDTDRPQNSFPCSVDQLVHGSHLTPFDRAKNERLRLCMHLRLSEARGTACEIEMKCVNSREVKQQNRYKRQLFSLST